MQIYCDNAEDSAYLREDEIIDCSHPLIQQTIGRIWLTEASEVEQVRHIFEFVRDSIPHSCDISTSLVTCTASTVLYQRTGLCYAKSHLLVAFLRAQGIPAGFCYQSLMLGDTPETGYVIHGLTAVYLQSIGRWIRLDVRGNKPGIQSEFSLGEEKLAFTVHPEFGEIDYPTIYANPHPEVISVLQGHSDSLEMCLRALPARL